jgi:hypothetical protein
MLLSVNRLALSWRNSMLLAVIRFNALSTVRSIDVNSFGSSPWDYKIGSSILQPVRQRFFAAEDKFHVRYDGQVDMKMICYT